MLYGIEPHGKNYVLYAGRDKDNHGDNLCTLSEFDANGYGTRRRIVDALNASLLGPPKPTVVGMFIPVYHRTDKVKACIESLRRNTDKGPGISWHVSIGFNGGSHELLSYLVDEVPTMENPWDSYEVVNYNRNLGKPEIVNMMVASKACDVHLDYVLSYDSDLVAITPSWLRGFVEAFEKFPQWQNLGALAVQQVEDCCHRLPNPTIYEGAGYKYLTGPKNEGVAGGAILTPYHVWRTIGGYLANRIYGADDAHYALACADHNLLMCVVNEVAVFHPRGDDPAYSAWKLRAVREQLSDTERKGFFE